MTWKGRGEDRVGWGVDKGMVVGVDIQDMEPVVGVEFVKLDFLDDSAPEKVLALAGRRADAVISDMAAPVTGSSRVPNRPIVDRY